MLFGGGAAVLDDLTNAVLDYKKGLVPLEVIRNRVLIEVFAHLRRYRRKGEDEVSEFLLDFHAKIEGLLTRFVPRGLPFRHFLLRTLRWQWNTFRAVQAKLRRQALLTLDCGLSGDGFSVAEGPPEELAEPPTLSAIERKRLVLLALKASPYLEEHHLEFVSRVAGVDFAWLQACQQKLRGLTAERRGRREQLADKRGDAFYRRLMAEDDARREADPERRMTHEHRASLYRTRLLHLSRQREAMTAAPTHRELAELLDMPKGSVDSSLYHLKRTLASVYGDHDRHGSRRKS
jgi:hypothetical protein